MTSIEGQVHGGIEYIIVLLLNSMVLDPVINSKLDVFVRIVTRKGKIENVFITT